MMNLLLLLLLIPGPPFHEQKQDHSFKAKQIYRRHPTVAFCDLLKHPELYNKKMVRIRAVFRRGKGGFMSIECPSCPKAGMVWPIFVVSFDSCTKSDVGRRFNENHPNIALEATMTGMFDNTRGGPMNAYPYQFQITCAEHVKVLSSGKAGGKFPPKANRIRCSGEA